MDPIAEFRALLERICDRETSHCPDHWTPANVLLGQSSVVSLLAHEYFGGMILRASLVRTPFAHLGHHHWNRISNGTRIDFTEDQFGEEMPKLEGDPKPRQVLLAQPDVDRRYQILRSRAEALGLFANTGREVAAPIFVA